MHVHAYGEDVDNRDKLDLELSIARELALILCRHTPTRGRRGRARASTPAIGPMSMLTLLLPDDARHWSTCTCTAASTLVLSVRLAEAA